MNAPARPTVRPLTLSEQNAVPALWNAAWGASRRRAEPLSAEARAGPAAADALTLTERVWRERLRRYHDDALLLGAFDESELVGVAYGRASDAGAVLDSWQPPGVGWLSLVAVKPQWQGAGVGTLLASEVVDRLRLRGCHSLRFGGEPNHLLAAIPQAAPAAAWRLARRLGARFHAAEFDLHLDLRLPVERRELPAGWRLSASEAVAGIAFVKRAFPGRWAEEVVERVAAGAVIITLHGPDAAEGAKTAVADGFCMVYRGDEGLVAPSLAWAGPTVADGPGLAGMGPLGISEEARGQGLGLCLVSGAAAWLQKRGATDLFIDWTSLTGFYGRLGARVWRAYQRAEAPIRERGA